jgi:hypothetical protein
LGICLGGSRRFLFLAIKKLSLKSKKKCGGSITQSHGHIPVMIYALPPLYPTEGSDLANTFLPVLGSLPPLTVD